MYGKEKAGERNIKEKKSEEVEKSKKFGFFSRVELESKKGKAFSSQLLPLGKESEGKEKDFFSYSSSIMYMLVFQTDFS